MGMVQDILAMKGEFIKAFHKLRKEHYIGLSEDFLWHLTCQDNTIGRMWQVHVSAVMTRRTKFFGGIGAGRVKVCVKLPILPNYSQARNVVAL